MDLYADNYNADANVEGEECMYPCEGTLATMTVNASNYGNEMYWELIDSTGLIIAYADAYATGDVAEVKGTKAMLSEKKKTAKWY